MGETKRRIIHELQVAGGINPPLTARPAGGHLHQAGDLPWLMASAPVRSSKADLSSSSPKPKSYARPHAPGAPSTKPAAWSWSSAPFAPPTTASTLFHSRSDEPRIQKG